MTLDDLRASGSAVITMADCARLLGVDERTVSRALDDGQLPAITVGRRRLIPRERLLALLCAPTTTSADPATGPADLGAVSAAPTTDEDVRSPRHAQGNPASAA